MKTRKWRLQMALSCIIFISSYGMVANANKNAFETSIEKSLESAQRDKEIVSYRIESNNALPKRIYEISIKREDGASSEVAKVSINYLDLRKKKPDLYI